MLADAFAKALRSLTLPGIMKLLLLCLVAYAIGWLALAWLMGALLALLVAPYGPDIFLLHAIGSVGGSVIAWFFFPLLYPVLVSFFDDQIADTIERADYPQLTPAAPPFWPTFRQDLIFTLKAIALNVICLPFYLIPLVGWCLYYALNGYLLGTQFFRMSAGRRASKGEAEALLTANRGAILLAGVAISFFATIPLVNLIAPVLGVATMLHLFHGVRGTGRVEILNG